MWWYNVYDLINLAWTSECKTSYSHKCQAVMPHTSNLRTWKTEANVSV